MSMLELLKKIEWGGRSYGQDGQGVSACPYCKQVCPDHEYAFLFLEEYRGHRPDCKLDAAIKSMSK